MQDSKNHQKFAIWAPSQKIVGLYLRNERMCRQSEENLLNSNISSTCSHNMVNFGPLGAEIVSLVWTTSKFQRVSRFSFVTAATSLNGSQPNFARCLAVSLADTLYIHFRGFLSRNGILPGATFTFRPRLALSYFGSVTARHSSSGRQPNFAVLNRGRHLYSAGRPSRWALAHILVVVIFAVTCRSRSAATDRLVSA